MRVGRLSAVGVGRHGAKEAARLDEAIVVLCILFGFSSSFSVIGLFDILNKGICALLCVVILGVYWNRPQPKWAYIILMLTSFVHAASFAYPVSPKEGIATYFMFAFLVLFVLYLANNLSSVFAALRRRMKFLQVALGIWTLVTLASFFMPMCYKVGWGGARYFTSFTTDSFEIAPVAMFMLAVDIMLYRLNGDRVRALMYSLVPLACVFAAGTRTYLVVVLLEFMLLLRMMVKRKGTYIFCIVAVLVVSAALVSVTNIGAKFDSAIFNTSDLSVFLEVFTNGRSEFWIVDLNAFLAGTPFEVLFGHGFSYVYEINQAVVGARLYAHNDFLNVLLNFGIIGMTIYLVALVGLVRAIEVELNGFSLLLFLFMWLFNAFFNMLYVYAAAVIGMGLIAVALSCGQIEEEHSQ